MIEHIADYHDFLKEVERILKPEGLFILSTPNKDWPGGGQSSCNPYHAQEFTLEELSDTLGEVFSQIDMYGQHT